jgi:hypothetical protein
MLDLVDKALVLSRTRLFAGLPDEALLELAEAAGELAASAGEPLEGGALYVAAQGGGVLGARGVLGVAEELHAGEDGALLCLARDDVLDAVTLYPALAARLCEILR